MIKDVRVMAAAVAMVWFGTTTANGQTTQAPGAAEGRAVASPPWTPTLRADGQPDIEGAWRAALTGTYDMTAVVSGSGVFQDLVDRNAGRPVAQRPSRVIDPPDGKIPYLPWAAAHQREIKENAEHPIKPEHIDPRARCLPGGVPREMFPTEFRLFQPHGYVVVLGGQKSVSRIIPLDGRPPLGDDIKLWMGDSRGRWEGNTLVVDVRNQNSKGRFDMVGNFASDAVHVVERWTFVDANTIQYTARIEDPKVYSRPWTVGSRVVRAAPSTEPYGDEMWEDACHEGERSADEMVLTPEAAEASKGRR